MRIDFHVHIGYFSKDSAIPLSHSTAKYIKKVGIDGIAITDHNEFAWYEKIQKFMKRYGITVIPGEEIKTNDGGEILCYFINDKISRGSWLEVIDEIHQQDGLAVLAHPYDFLRSNWARVLSGQDRTKLHSLISLIDGIEIYNARNYSFGANKKAELLATKFGKIPLAGSDAHNLFEIGSAFTTLNVGSRDLDELLQAIKHSTLNPVKIQILRNNLFHVYSIQRLISAVWRKAHSALNRSSPAFKNWQIHKYS
ncbi:MAG: PHP-associated domain-containing protein [Promethearchaeota archaeon]